MFNDTDELFTVLPETEDQLWEWKGASVLTDKNELKAKLSTEVSAFANTGGGSLIFGINDKGRVLEACVDTIGKDNREKMSDYLGKMVQYSVDPPLQGHRAYRIPFAGDPTKGIYLVEVPDSPHAPHQGLFPDLQTYWRVGDRAVAAPIRHQQMLRDRVTKSVIAVVKTESVVQAKPWGESLSKPTLKVWLNLTVENQSSLLANPWAVRLATAVEHSAWFVVHPGPRLPLSEGVQVQDSRSLLFPKSQVRFPVELNYEFDPREDISSGAIFDFLGNLRWTIQTFTQDHAGDELEFQPIEYANMGDAYKISQELALARSRGENR